MKKECLYILPKSESEARTIFFFFYGFCSRLVALFIIPREEVAAVAAEVVLYIDA